MARKPRTPVSSTRRPRRTRLQVPEEFQIVTSATVATESGEVKVPMLVLYGEWLTAVGFPIGSAAFLKADKQGELAVQRLGLRVPRRLVIRGVT